MLINRLPIKPRKSTLLLRPAVGIDSQKERVIVEEGGWEEKGLTGPDLI